MERPVRIVVAANSAGYYVRPYRERPEDGSYGELLPRILGADGIEAEVVNSAGWFLQIHEAYRQMEPLVIRHCPDVVITNFGMAECEPKIIPTSLLKWIYTPRSSSAAPAMLARRLLVGPVGRVYRKFSRYFIRILPVPPRLSPRRFEYEMRRFVGFIRRERKALVLMLAINPPGDRVELTLPGTAVQAVRYNTIMRTIADEMGPDVRLVDVHSMMEDLGLEKALPDGLHYSPYGHQKVAELLASEISAWFRERRFPT